MNIAESIRSIKAGLPEGVKLVAVSKTQPLTLIMEAYEAGQRCFGENKVQDLVSKAPQLPPDIEWHFIGHLQSNKVRLLLPYVRLIHSIDSVKLLSVVDQESARIEKTTPCLLQFHIAREESKFGFSLPEAMVFFQSSSYQLLTSVEIVGVMGMATFTEDVSQVRQEFRTLKSIFDELKDSYFRDKESFNQLSMGMSDDYHLAIEEGSTLVRIGTALFGARNLI